MRRVLAGATLTVGMVLACAGTASAWWAEGGGLRSGAFGTVTVTALPGEQNDLIARNSHLPVTLPGGGLFLHDESATVTDPPAGRGQGCTKVDDHTLHCIGVGFMDDPVSVTYLLFDLGDGDDRLRTPVTSDSLFESGGTGSGNDVVESNDLDGASVNLGDGDDRITVRRGTAGEFLPTDSISGGAGNDVLRLLNGGPDNPDCGDGTDTLYADPGETNANCETVHTLPAP